MKKIEPYRDLTTAAATLDNGGRFYNFFTTANDGVITKAEVSKVGGLFIGKQSMSLFLEMSISALKAEDQTAIIAKLENKLQDNYQKYKAQHLLPSNAQSDGILSSNAIITGIPTLTDSHSALSGFIMVPIVTGEVTTMTMIPLIDQYDVYEVRDTENATTFLIAHAKGKDKLPAKKIKIAGVLKELQTKEKDSQQKTKFLEALYYMDIAP